MEDKQLNVARQKFSGFLSPAQLEFKISTYENAAKKTYDPKKGSYSSHLANHLNKLNRDVHSSMNNLGVSENNGLSLHKMRKANDEFFMQHDREPTSQELSTITGVNTKFINKYKDTLSNSMAISRDVNLAPDDIKFNSFTYGLNDEDKALASSSVGLGSKPKGMSKTSYFRKMKEVKDKIQSNYLHGSTRIIHDS
jgi:hypothetical protein